MTEQPPVGIDLGTTFSCVGIWRNNQVEIIANQEGDRTTPSYVSYKNNDILVGKPALQLLVMNPTNTVYDMKRLIGNKNAIDCIYKNNRYWKFKVLHEPDVKVEIKVNNQIKHIEPEEVSAEILKKLKKSAEEVTRTPVKNVVLSVPAYFDEQQKKATIKAAEMAGLDVLELISEPSAAAYAYGYDQAKVSNINLLVFDFGGGTLDVVIVKVKNGNFDVVAIGGNTQLGGRDFDNILMDYFLNIIENKYRKDVTNNDKLLPKLLRECIDLKHMLTATEEANLFLGNILHDIDENIEMDLSLFNKLCFPLYHCIEMVIQGTLKEANMKTTEIDEIILVGGSSRIPEITKLLSKMFTDKPLNRRLNPDEAIAYGATIRATQIQNQAVMDIKLSETNAKRLPKLLSNFKNLSINSKVAKKRSPYIESDKKTEAVKSMNANFGIHLGANYTRVAIKNANKNDDPPHILRDIDIPREGNADRIASVVSFHEDRIKVGTDGLENQEQEVVFDACRVGTDYDNVEENVIWHAKRSSDGTYLVKKGSAQISQEVIVLEILNRIKKIFEERKYGPIKNLVISTPYNCKDAYKRMIINAATKADFNKENLVLIEETEAAAKSFYELSVPNQYPHNLLVFKFGAGSFSISLAQKQSKDDRTEIFIGNPRLGGEDITNLLMQYFLKNFEKDLAEIRKKDLRESCERIKSDLSYLSDTKIIIEGEPLIDINRDIFDGICKNIIDEIRDHMLWFTREMKTRKIEIHDVLLVGGSTRLHFIREIIDSALKSAQKSDYRYDTVVIAEEAIALGCAIHGSEPSIEIEHETEKKKKEESFMDSPIKRKLYEEATKWYNEIQNCRHLLGEEKDNYQTDYCKKYIQNLRDDYLEESKSYRRAFLAMAERRYQELKYKNDILEQFKKIRDKLEYILDEDLKRRCKNMLDAGRLQVYTTSIEINEKILENFLKEIQIELCLCPAELKNPAQNLKPKVSEWLELDIQKTLIMPKLYYCKYVETSAKYRV